MYKICDVCGKQDKNVKFNSNFNGNLCIKHYHQFHNFGKILDNNSRTCNDLNEIIINGDIAKISIYNKYSEKIYEAIIDSEDVEKVKNFKWRSAIKRGKVYIVSNKREYLARLILQCTNKKIQIDHINGNTLDNRKCNLRETSESDNKTNLKPKNTNKLGIRGVSKDNKYNRYVVDFSYKKDRFYLKPFESLEEAIYCRYLLESKINPIYRYKENDNKLFYYINQLSCSQKYEIEQYVNLKISEKGIYNET